MYKRIKEGVCAPKGFLASGIHCGIRKNKDKKDLALIYSEKMCIAASTYTLNKVQGAPILLTKKHLHNAQAQAILCNSGNANTCNPDGLEIAQAMAEACAQALHIDAEDIIIASTGVIGQPLALEPMTSHMPLLVQQLSNQNNTSACEAIMTTDTFTKDCAIELEIDDVMCKIGGISKGSGMIHPNMATMLCFVTSDVNITKPLLQKAVQNVVQDTFNMVSVDGDTSTNDMLSVMCNGCSNNPIIDTENEAYYAFERALHYVCEDLAKQIAKDGEGASKLLTCVVEHAKTIHDAKATAKAIITSSLFKSAMFGNDANWGRILCALGYAQSEVDVQKVDVYFQSEVGCIQVCKDGKGLAFDEDLALKILNTNEVTTKIDLNDGTHKATAWGCDLTYEYVRINGEYRT